MVSFEPVPGTDHSPLVAALRAGTPDAFERLYAAYRTRLFGFLSRLCRDREAAEDLFQNVWLKVARHAGALREDSDLDAWLFTIARNEHRSWRRCQMLDLSRVLAFGREVAAWPEAHGPGSNAELELIERALGSLGEADREVILLVAVEGLSAPRAAQVLDISHAALRQRLSRARARLDTAMQTLGAEPAACPQAR